MLEIDVMIFIIFYYLMNKIKEFIIFIPYHDNHMNKLFNNIKRKLLRTLSMNRKITTIIHTKIICRDPILNLNKIRDNNREKLW